MRFAGIDVGSQAHVIAIVDDRGAVLLKPTSFAEDTGGYERMFSLLGEPLDLLVALESTGHYGRNLLASLIDKGYATALVNPLRTRRFAEEDLTRAKTDSIDALGIARFAAQKRPAVTSLPSRDLGELRELTRLHDRLDQDLGDRLRQLHRLVALCFPEFKRYVQTLDSQRAVAILRKYPTAASFHGRCTTALAALRTDECHHQVGPALARQLIDAARVSVARHDGQAYRGSIRFICDDISALRRKLQELEASIDSAVRAHPVALLLTTIRGVGTLSAARIVTTVGDPASFTSSRALAAYVGVVPHTSHSGLRRPPSASLSPLGNSRLRYALYMTTVAAIRCNPWLQAFYTRLKDRGKPSKVAMIAAERKLLCAVYSIAKSHRPFVAHLDTRKT